MIIYIVIALLNGILISVSRLINTRLSLDVGVIKTSFWNHIVGFIFLTFLVLLTKKYYFIYSLNLHYFTYLGGILGALFVLVNSYIFKIIGGTKGTCLVITGQMLTGIVIDYKGHHLISIILQFIGVTIILFGVFFLKKRTR